MRRLIAVLVAVVIVVTIGIAAASTAASPSGAAQAAEPSGATTSFLPQIYTAALPTATPTPIPDPFINGDFEQGRGVGWAESSSNGYDLVLSLSEGNLLTRSGQWSAWLGGASNELSILSQSFTVSSSQPYLIYYYARFSEEGDCGADTGVVLLNNTPIETIELCDGTNSSNWEGRVANLSSLIGQNVTLTFRVQTNGNDNNTNVFVDDVSVSATGEAARTDTPLTPYLGTR